MLYNSLLRVLKCAFHFILTICYQFFFSIYILLVPILSGIVDRNHGD